MVAVNAVPTLNTSSAPLPVSSNFNGSAAQLLAPYAAAAAAAASFPNDVLGMMPYFYPGLAGYYPGAGVPFMQPPAIVPGTSRPVPGMNGQKVGSAGTYDEEN